MVSSVGRAGVQALERGPPTARAPDELTAAVRAALLDARRAIRAESAFIATDECIRLVCKRLAASLAALAHFEHGLTLAAGT